METATATARGRTGVAAAAVRPQELRAALDRALELVDADETIGPRIAATGMRMRIEIPDARLVLHLAGAESERNLDWSFDATPPWRPQLELEMSSATANRYLQGRESLAIGIAHGQIRARGDSRSALRFLPAARLICGTYRRVVEADFPDLVVA